MTNKPKYVSHLALTKFLLALCLKASNILDDATMLIQKEKREEAKRSEASGQVYNTLLNFVMLLSK
jgi:hypothetical protein